MFEAFIVTLREGIEAALAVSIILACLRKMGRRLETYVYMAIANAVIASIIGADILAHAPIPEELLEGSLMLAAAITIGPTVIWMWKNGRNLKGDIEQKIIYALEGPNRSGVEPQPEVKPYLRPHPAMGLFIVTFLLIFREGLETAVFMSAMTVSSNSLMNVLGAVLGLALAILFGVFLMKGTLRVDVARFLKVTAVVLMVLVLQLLIGAVHEFAEYGLVHMSARQMAIIGPLVRNNVLFVLSVLALPIILMFIPGRAAAKDTADADLTAPQRRLLLSGRRRERLYRLLATTTGVVIMGFLSVSYVYSSTPRSIDPPVMLNAAGDTVAFPLHDLADGKMHRYGVQVGDDVVRFIAVRRADGKPAVALDACEMCGSIGYVQNAEGLMCLNCTAQINPESIGLKGGCNPVPLSEGRHVGESEIMSLAELRSAAPRFHKVGASVTVTCPVCQMKLAVEDASEHYEYHGKTYYFCRMGSCNGEFKAHPEKYVSH